MIELNLPEVPTTERLHQQVDILLSQIQTQDAATLSRVKPFVADLATVSEKSAQRIIARDYSFTSWSKLIEFAEQQKTSSADRSENHSEVQSQPVFATDQIACEFLRLVVLVYSETENADPLRFTQAAELLEAHPEIRNESIHTAAAVGDVERINQWIAQDPALVNQRGGHHDWEPLMYAAYSRLPLCSTLEAGRVLLQHGADPNAFYLWGGQYCFTVLTGVFGQGEGGPERLPEHPDTEEFARLLLSAGANPNDSQSAYNRMFTPDNLCLELLLEFGIGKTDKNNWLLRSEKDREQLEAHPEATLHYQLCHAIRQGFFERVKLLVDNGADLTQRQVESERQHRPLEIALLCRQQVIADYLQSSGAPEPEFDDIDHFYIACMGGDNATARALLAADPELITATEERIPGVLAQAVDVATPEALSMMLQLGFDPNAYDMKTALHQAAWNGDIKRLEILIDAGGDTSVRDYYYFASPMGWALENRQTAAVAFLEKCKMDIFTAVAQGLVAVVAEQLADDPSKLAHRFLDYRPNPDAFCPHDGCTPLAFAMRMNRPAIVELLLDHGASTDWIDDEGVTLRSLLMDWAVQADYQSIVQRLAN
ncbi:MAG: ankyrin repeat domain-containing protein [Granulosicoccus sp.]|nr:ankyrin repeat domain-containing protein [Granulosicoccus sp.]